MLFTSEGKQVAVKEVLVGEPSRWFIDLNDKNPAFSPIEGLNKNKYVKLIL